MHVDCVPLHRVRQDDFTERFVRASPEAGQPAERRTELDTRPPSRFVHRQRFAACHAGLCAIDVERRTSSSSGNACRDRGPGVQRPVGVCALAEDLDGSDSLRIGAAKHELQPPHLFLAVHGFGEDQRAVQLQLIHGRGKALGEQRRGDHRAVQRPGRHYTPEYLVLLQPRRVGRPDLGLERDLTTRGFVPLAEERMTTDGPGPLGRVEPEATALERIPRD